jgi:preprotein translocase subunit YajC
MSVLLLLAEGQQPETPPFAAQLPLFLILGLLFMLMVWMPGRKQEKKRKEQLSKLKKGDRIVNSGGIIGVVDSIKDKDEEVVLKGGLRITRSSIVRIEEETKDSSA